MTSSTTSPHRRWLILAVLGLAQLMVLLDATIVNTLRQDRRVDRHRAAEHRGRERDQQLRRLACDRHDAMAQAAVNGYTAAFWRSAAIFAAGAIVCGAPDPAWDAAGRPPPSPCQPTEHSIAPCGLTARHRGSRALPGGHHRYHQCSPRWAGPRCGASPT
jgi:hypothetical protein